MRVLFGLVLSVLWTASAVADAPSTHGMVVFGGVASATYASHLPMFHAPHDRQVIIEIALGAAPGSQALVAYKAAKGAGKTLFTLEPEVMDLEKIANGSKTEFTASLYDGHFERGGQDLGKVRVQVKKVVFSSKLDPTPSPQDERYFVFGGRGEYFAAHVIQGKPSFDAILEVSQPYRLVVSRCRTRVCAEPAKTPIPDEKLPLALSGPSDPRLIQGSSPLSLGDLTGGSADVKSVPYLEEGDLE